MQCFRLLQQFFLAPSSVRKVETLNAALTRQKEILQHFLDLELFFDLSNQLERVVGL